MIKTGSARWYCSLNVQIDAYVIMESFREDKHSRVKACTFSAVAMAELSVTSNSSSMGPPK